MAWWSFAVAIAWALLAIPTALPYAPPFVARSRLRGFTLRVHFPSSSSPFPPAAAGGRPKWFKLQAPTKLLTVADLNKLISDAKLPRAVLRELAKELIENDAESFFSDDDLHSRARCMQLLLSIDCIDQAVAMASLCFAQRKWIPMHIFDSIVRSMCSSSPVHSVLAFIDKGLSTKQLLSSHTFNPIFRICGSFDAYKALLLRMRSVSAIPSPVDVLAAMRSCEKDAYSVLLILDYCDDLDIPCDHDMFAQCFHSMHLAAEAHPHDWSFWATLAASLWRDMTIFHAISPSPSLVERALRLFARAQHWQSVVDALGHSHRHMTPPLFALVLEVLVQEKVPREILLPFIKTHVSAMQAISTSSSSSSHAPQMQRHAAWEPLPLAVEVLHKYNQSEEALRLFLNESLSRSALPSITLLGSIRSLLLQQSIRYPPLWSFLYQMDILSRGIASPSALLEQYSPHLPVGDLLPPLLLSLSLQPNVSTAPGEDRLWSMENASDGGLADYLAVLSLVEQALVDVPSPTRSMPPTSPSFSHDPRLVSLLLTRPSPPRPGLAVDLLEGMTLYSVGQPAHLVVHLPRLSTGDVSHTSLAPAFSRILHWLAAFASNTSPPVFFSHTAHRHAQDWACRVGDWDLSLRLFAARLRSKASTGLGMSSLPWDEECMTSAVHAVWQRESVETALGYCQRLLEDLVSSGQASAGEAAGSLVRYVLVHLSASLSTPGGSLGSLRASVQQMLATLCLSQGLDEEMLSSLLGLYPRLEASTTDYRHLLQTCLSSPSPLSPSLEALHREVMLRIVHSSLQQEEEKKEEEREGEGEGLRDLLRRLAVQSYLSLLHPTASPDLSSEDWEAVLLHATRTDHVDLARHGLAQRVRQPGPLSPVAMVASLVSSLRMGGRDQTHRLLAVYDALLLPPIEAALHLVHHRTVHPSTDLDDMLSSHLSQAVHNWYVQSVLVDCLAMWAMHTDRLDDALDYLVVWSARSMQTLARLSHAIHQAGVSVRYDMDPAIARLAQELSATAGSSPRPPASGTTASVAIRRVSPTATMQERLTQWEAVCSSPVPLILLPLEEDSPGGASRTSRTSRGVGGKKRVQDAHTFDVWSLFQVSPVEGEPRYACHGVALNRSSILHHRNLFLDANVHFDQYVHALTSPLYPARGDSSPSSNLSPKNGFGSGLPKKASKTGFSAASLSNRIRGRRHTGMSREEREGDEDSLQLVSALAFPKPYSAEYRSILLTLDTLNATGQTLPLDCPLPLMQALRLVHRPVLDLLARKLLFLHARSPATMDLSMFVFWEGCRTRIYEPYRLVLSRSPGGPARSSPRPHYTLVCDLLGLEPLIAVEALTYLQSQCVSRMETLLEEYLSYSCIRLEEEWSKHLVPVHALPVLPDILHPNPTGHSRQGAPAEFFRAFIHPFAQQEALRIALQHKGCLSGTAAVTSPASMPRNASDAAIPLGVLEGESIVPDDDGIVILVHSEDERWLRPSLSAMVGKKSHASIPNAGFQVSSYDPSRDHYNVQAEMAPSVVKIVIPSKVFFTKEARKSFSM